MHGRTQQLLAGSIAVLTGCAAALAQTPPPDATVPVRPTDAPASAPADRPPGTVVVPRIIVSPSGTPGLEPVRPNLPPTAAQDLSLSASPPLLREGAFISGARARLVRGRSARWYAIFDSDGSGRAIPPMIVMENSNLVAMERVADREPAGTRVRLSGRVTVYRDRNFLLPSAPPLIERTAPADATSGASAASERASAAASGTPAPPTASAAGAKPTGEPSIEQIMSELDRAVGQRRTGPANAAGSTPSNASERSAPNPAPLTGPGATPGTTMVQEPTEPGVTAGFLTARRSRIVRSADGSLTAVTDAGSSGRAEPPMTVLPCQNLTAIEGILDTTPGGGETLTFTLTGDVFIYKSRRYLLPTMYNVNRTSDIVMPAH